MSNEAPRKLTDKEISKLLRDYLKALKPIMAKATGEIIPVQLSTNKRKEAGKFVNQIVDFGIEYEKMNSQTLPKNFKLKEQIRATDSVLNMMFGVNSENPIKDFISAYDLQPLYDQLFSDKKHAINLRESMQKIFYDIDKIGEISKFNILIESMGLETVIANMQSANRVNKNQKYIQKPRKKISVRIVEKYIEYYKELSAFIEPLIIILYGMKLILDKNYKPFHEIKNKNTIGNIVSILKKQNNFEYLVRSYNHHIRNSIVHLSYVVDPLEKKVDFSDKSYKQTLSFLDFVNYVQEIVRLTIILSRVEYELYFLQLQAYKSIREKILSSN